MMSGKKVSIFHEEPSRTEFIKEENFCYALIGCEDESNDQHEGNGEVNSFDAVPLSQEEDYCVSDTDVVHPLAIKKEDGSEKVVGFQIKSEEEDGEVNPFEAVFVFKEEDISVSDTDAVDPLAMGTEDGREEVGFEIKNEDGVLVKNGSAVSQVHNSNGYPSCSKNGSNSKSQEGSIVCETCLKNKHHSLASDVKAGPESHDNEKCQCVSIDKSNPSKPTIYDKPFKCPYCEYMCSQNTRLKQHLLTHSAVKPYHCSYCEFRCSRKETLNTHIMTHSGVKPFKCSYCEYKCSRKDSLKRHTLTHTAVKPFQCVYCGLSYSVKAYLKIHMLTHTDYKPFQCSHCEYKCSQNINLKRHMLTHSGDKPFQCFHCEVFNKREP